MGWRECDHVVEQLRIVVVYDPTTPFTTQACRRCGGVWTRDPTAPARKQPFWRLLDDAGNVDRWADEENG